jgi:hypothetical protein
MAMRVVGAGLGRTGTLSLKVALERLLGGRCYHMAEVFEHPEHVASWHAATRDDFPDWHALFRDYRAAVNWPASAFWYEIAAAFPDAIVLLSVRDPESWWKSAHDTIFSAIDDVQGEWRDMIDALFATRFTSAIGDRAASIAAFERHNENVRRTVPPSRLLEWRATDGWAPLCAALGVPVPAEPFPKVNTTVDFLARKRAAAARENTPKTK